MDSMLVWGLVATSALTFVIALICAYVSFRFGRRNSTHQNELMVQGACSRLSPTARLKRLGLKVESLQLGCDLSCNCNRTFGGGGIAINIDNGTAVFIFCVWCGAGIRRHPMPSSDPYVLTLYELLDVLEEQAARNGTYVLPDRVKQPRVVNFITIVEGTGGFRHPPMRVRVDPETKTVRPVENEALAEVEVADHQAGEAAKKALSN